MGIALATADMLAPTMALEKPEVPVDATALDLFRKGLQYATGQGVAMDFVAAHKFFNLAALRGFEAAKERRREIASVMSPEEIATAQRAAREWLKVAN